MNRATAFVTGVALWVNVSGVEAAVSRTTEYHQLGMQLQADTVFNIELPDGLFLSGYVKDQSGKAVANATLCVLLTDDNVPSLGGRTDGQGKFSFPVQTGTYNIYVTPPTSDSVTPSRFSRLIKTKKEGILVGGDTSAGTITEPSGYIWSGKVLPPSGSMMVFGGFLYTFPAGSGIEGFHVAQFGTSFAEMSQFAIALASGNYKAVLMPLQTFSSTGSPIPAGYTTSKLTISADKVANLKLKKGYKLSGTVKDSSGSAMDGLLWVYQKTAQFVEDVYVAIGYVADGKYEMYVPNGSYTMHFVPLMDTSYKGRGTRTETDVVMPAGTKTLDIVADDGIILSGKITDAKKKAAKSATVFARDVTTGPWGVNQVVYAGLATSTSKGQYRLTLPQGTYDIMAYPGSGGTLWQSSVSAGVMLRAARELGRGYAREQARGVKQGE